MGNNDRKYLRGDLVHNLAPCLIHFRFSGSFLFPSCSDAFLDGKKDCKKHPMNQNINREYITMPDAAYRPHNTFIHSIWEAKSDNHLLLLLPSSSSLNLAGVGVVQLLSQLSIGVWEASVVVRVWLIIKDLLVGSQ